MNLLLINNDRINETTVTITGRQLDHIKTVHRANEGDTIRVGQLNGLMGNAVITKLTSAEAELSLTLDTPPPKKLPLTLILGLPRPKMLKRVIQTATAMGVETLYLINSYRVEKSYWQTPQLRESKLQENIYLGLEQARDTKPLSIELRDRFKPFVEDELPSLLAKRPGLLAHPVSNTPITADLNAPCSLIVGPEGGFIPYEVNKFVEAGCRVGHMGSRILRVETAVPALISKLYSY